MLNWQKADLTLRKEFMLIIRPGIIVTYVSWRNIFWLQVALAGVATLAVILLIPETIHRARKEDLVGLTKKQQHPTDVKPRHEVTVQIDLKQRGVGGDNSWGALPHDAYRLLDKTYSYSYTLRLVENRSPQP